MTDHQIYFESARQRLMDECIVSNEQLVDAHSRSMNGVVVIHLATRDEANIIAAAPGMKTLYKHVFLKNPAFKMEVIRSYQERGYDWVDIVPLNRLDWKIFLWYENKPRETSFPIDGMPPYSPTSYNLFK
mmetsp:Transcript_18678/g.33102  ORF Transcript_18678/g.33102 Transcript_18678/m.33102 type:complete len:130 (-) Transcript_18678:532-921(-)